MTLTQMLTGAAALVPLAWAAGNHVGRRAGWLLAAGFTALAGMVLWLWARCPQPITAEHRWLPSLDVSLRLRLDGLGLVFALVVLVIGALVMAYAVHYLPRGRHGHFYALLTFFAVAMLGLVMADDVVLLWVFWEFTTICSFLLIQQSGPKGKGPALRTLLVTGGGGLCLLAAAALTVSQVGTSSLTEALRSPLWSQRPGLAAVVATLVAVAAFTKCAQFPFHGWLPDAMVASTPVSAYLHAAAMVKAGIYLLLRFSTAFAHVPVWNVLLVTLGLGTALLGAVYALQRFDLKELLAYSTISQLGLLVATIGIGTTYALLGAIVHVMAHAIFKSALFMAVGLIDHETGTRDIRRLSGLRRTMPISSLCLALAAAAMAGLPPWLGFVSKESLFKAMSLAPFGQASTVAICVVAMAAATCTFAYSARMLRPLLGDPPEQPPHEAPALMIAPVLTGAVGGLLLGLVGPVLEPLTDLAASAIRPDATGADLSLWHGVSPALVMSLIVIGLGAVLVIARQHVDRAVDRPLGPVRAVDMVEGFRDSSIRAGELVSALTRSDAPARHLSILTVSLAVLVAGAISLQPIGLPSGEGRRLDWLLAALVSLGVILTLRAQSRVALVTTVGIVGFSTALAFFDLGAPDVAITQLLVEILTVAVMVLLLVRLPVLFHETSLRRTLTAGVIGLVAGAMALVLALSVQSVDSLSDVGSSYLSDAYQLSGGTNIVNTILVDFRAFDTLGEMAVLGVAAVAIWVALQARGLLPHTQDEFVVPAGHPAINPDDNTLTLRMADRIIGPILFGLSVWFFLRGHYHPGGGFIGALVAGAAVTLIFLAAPRDNVPRLARDYLMLVGVGIVLAVSMGLVGLLDGAFLRPLYVEVFGVQLSTGLVFDVGVYLTVLGLILGTLSKLGLDGPNPTPTRLPGAVTARLPEDEL